MELNILYKPSKLFLGTVYFALIAIHNGPLYLTGWSQRCHFLQVPLYDSYKACLQRNLT